MISVYNSKSTIEQIESPNDVLQIKKGDNTFNLDHLNTYEMATKNNLKYFSKNNSDWIQKQLNNYQM